MRLTKVHSLIKVVFLGLVSLGFIACDNFITESQVKKEIEDAIAYANSSNITVTVSPLNNLHGQVTTGSVVIAKIGYPFTVNFVVDDAYTFGGWAAYSNFTSISDTPLSDEYIEFSDEDGKGPGKSLKCSVTIKKKIENIYIVPLCGSKPAVTLTEPLAAEKDVSITTPLKVTFNKKMDLSSILQNDENGNVTGFKNFKVIYSKSNDDGESDSNGDITDYFDAQNTVLKKNGTQIVIPFKNKLDSTKWLPSASYITVELGANLSAATSEGGAVLDTTYTWTFVTGTTADVKGPAIKSAALALTNGTSEKTLESKNWNDWADFQNYRVAADYDSFKYSITADDSLTGDTGVLRYEVIQRLMYADKGAKLPNGRVLATATQFFNKNGEWNDVLGCSKNDFEVATEIDGNESGVENKVLLLDELFTKYSTDGIYQITLTAVDALENYSDVPATFYFVRDTTSPCLSTNLNNISVNGGFVVSEGTVNGRYAKTGKEEITFVPKKTIVDEGLFSVNGNSLQTASKTVNWKISFSTSSTEDTHSVSSEYCNANSDTGLTLTISDLSTTQTYYPWLYFKDDLGNESAGECLLSQPVYVDATAPVINVECENSNTSSYIALDGTVTIYSDNDEDILTVSCFDSMSGIASISVLKNNVQQTYSSSIKITHNDVYEFVVQDGVGNQKTNIIKNEVKSKYTIPYFLSRDWKISNEMEELDVVYYSNYTSPLKLYTYNHYINKQSTITLTFTAVPSTIPYKAGDYYFAKNGIKFLGMKVLSYKICTSNTVVYSTSSDGMPTSTGSSGDEDWVSEILLQDDNVTEDIDYIPIEAETIKGAIYCSVTLAIKDFTILKEDEEFSFNFSVSNNVNTYTESYNMTYDAEGPIPFSAENSPCKISLDNNGNYILTKYCSKELVSGNTVLYDIGTVATLGSSLKYYEIEIGKQTDVCFVTIKGDTTNPKTKYVSSVNVIPGTVLEFHDAMDNITEVTTAYELESGPSVDIDAKYTNGKYWYSDNNGVTVNCKSNIGFSKCFYSDGTNTFVTYDSSITLAPDSETSYTIKAFDIKDNCTENTIIICKDVTAPECEINGVVPYQTDSLWYRSGTLLTKYQCYGIAANNYADGNNLTGFQSDSKTSYSITSRIDCNNSIKNYNYICKAPGGYSAMVYYISILFSIKETECGIAENGIEILASDKKTVISVAEGITFGTEAQAQTVAYCNLYFDRSSDITDGLSIRVTDALGNSTTTPLYSIQIDNDGPVFKQISTTTTGATIQKVNNTTYKIYAGSATTTSVKVNFMDEKARMFSVLYSTDSSIQYTPGMKGCTYLPLKLQNELEYTASLTSGTTYYFFGVDRLGNYTTITVQVVSGSGSGSTTITN